METHVRDPEVSKDRGTIMGFWFHHGAGTLGNSRGLAVGSMSKRLILEIRKNRK